MGTTDDNDNDREYEIKDTYRRTYVSTSSSPKPRMDPKPPGKVKTGRQSHKPATVHVSQVRVLTPEEQAEEQRIREIYAQKRHETSTITHEIKQSKLRATPPVLPIPGKTF